MNAGPRSLKFSIIALLAAAALGACVAGGGYDGDVGVGVGVGYVGDYYEPCCYGYGGWGPGYRVGPPRFRGGDHGPGPGRSAPSIPSHSRGGGGGGGHGGGGGGHR
jgi:hypothetical protein